jgi:hypothetical protein
MDDQHPEASESTDEPLEEEVVEGVVVVSAAREVEPVREGPPAFVHVAAVAATGFVAGAATAAMLGRRRLVRGATPRPTAVPALRGAGAYEVVASHRYIVDVHTIARR